MARLRYNGLTATLGAALTSGGTTITFTAALTSAAGAVPTLAGSDYIPLSILDASGNLKEIVSLTAYTSGSTTGTIARAQESTTAVAHSSGVDVVHSATVRDVNRRYAEASRTSGDISTAATTAITALDTGLDLTLAASEGDQIVYGITGTYGSQAVTIGLDVYTMVGGSQVNPFGFGLSASLAGAEGVSGWLGPNGQTTPISGEIRRTLTAGDISAGAVTLRLYYAKSATTARTVFAGSLIGLRVWAENRGPV